MYIMDFFFLFLCSCDCTDSSWRDQSLEQKLHSGAQVYDQMEGGASAEQQMIQAQEMASYRKRLSSLSFSDAQRLTQIDLTQSDSHVTAQVGHPAYLKCAVLNLGDQLVCIILVFLTRGSNRRHDSLSWSYHQCITIE